MRRRARHRARIRVSSPARHGSGNGGAVARNKYAVRTPAHRASLPPRRARTAAERGFHVRAESRPRATATRSAAAGPPTRISGPRRAIDSVFLPAPAHRRTHLSGVWRQRPPKKLETPARARAIAVQPPRRGGGERTNHPSLPLPRQLASLLAAASVTLRRARAGPSRRATTADGRWRHHRAPRHWDCVACWRTCCRLWVLRRWRAELRPAATAWTPLPKRRRDPRLSVAASELVASPRRQWVQCRLAPTGARNARPFQCRAARAGRRCEECRRPAKPARRLVVRGALVAAAARGFARARAMCRAHACRHPRRRLCPRPQLRPPQR